MNSNQPIGVFDSGVGGLSILAQLQKLLPRENFVFLADQLYVPYGEKSKKELLQLVYKITDYFIREHNIKMLVIACNTATCYTIKELRGKYRLPIVGTEPAIKPAARNNKSGLIAVISTPATSKSKTIKRLIREFAQGIEVLNIGCKNLENTVEEGSLNDAKVKNLLKKYLDPVKNSRADQLVLGCTHYPFLKETIRKILGPKVKLVDSGGAIAKRTKYLVEKHKISNERGGKALYFTTGNSEKFEKVAMQLLKKRVHAKKVQI
jgi:glutamate racemase